MAKTKKEVRGILTVLSVLIIISLATVTVFAAPVGVGPTIYNTSAFNDSSSFTLIEAQAGNMTELQPISASANSDSWAGFMGNVSGTVQLANADGEVFYNWTSTTPTGEVYAANSTITFINIQCFNFTATGNYSTGGGCDDWTNGGGTSLCGINASTLDHTNGILNFDYGDSSDDPDGVNDTFFDATSHNAFSTSGNSFSAGECPAANLNNDTGQVAEWQEALLWDPDNNNTVFAGIINDNNIASDGSWQDFQIMVLEDGHGVNAETTTSYYFYIELG